MVFSSIPFIFLFLPIFALIYYIVPFKAKNYVLLVFSLVFYAWGEPVYIVLMLAVTLINYFAGLIIDRLDDNSKRKLILVIAVVLSVSALGYFKYADFLINNLNAIFSLNIGNLNVRLPIGISFFTFQTLSYTIDLYKKDIEVEKNYAFFLMYVSMFPQLIAGPIVRFSTIQNELRNRKITADGFYSGMLRFCLGLFKKVLIANQIGKLWDYFNTTDTTQMSVLGGWLGLLAFTIQLYFDFSAYSDMAIGMGNMMGFHFLENFNYPLSATSITDFWRKWHISMSTWFRDYIYIQLGGNRCSKIKNVRNIVIVWFTTGLWHGASWNFVLWGMFHAIFLLAEKNIYGALLNKASKIIQHFYSIFLVVTGFAIFAMPDFNRLFNYFKAVFGFGNNAILSNDFLYYLDNFKFVLLVSLVLSFPVYPYLKEKLQNMKNRVFKFTLQGISIIAFIFLFLSGISSLVADSYNPFLYFRF